MRVIAEFIVRLLRKQEHRCITISPRCAVKHEEQEGLAVASIAQDDPSTLPGDDPFPHARMHRDCNAW